MAYHDYQENFEEFEEIPIVRNMPHKEQRMTKHRRPKFNEIHRTDQFDKDLTHQNDGQDAFDFTYKASRHERMWIVDSLGGYYESQWLDDVLRLLKGGKEAHVYQCLKNPSVDSLEGSYIAAKVYRPRRFRNLKNDHIYREGRERLGDDGNEIINGGKLHAISKRTGYGLELMHTSWIQHEFQTMQSLFAAGVDVPRPIASSDNAILMAYIGGDGMPAPTLNSVRLDRKEAKKIFERLIYNVEIMLANNRVHGDLSAFNVLYWDGEITLIDFPQAFHPDTNRSAYQIFERDLRRVCSYFSAQGVNCEPRRLALDLWRASGRRVRPNVHPGLLDADNEADRAFWQRQTGSA